MKRDMELIREILIYIEENNSIEDFFNENDSEEHKQAKFYHLKLLADAGLVSGVDYLQRRGLEGIGLRITNNEMLTWEGHDFLDAIRSDSVWNKAKAVVAKVGGTTSFAVWKAVVGDVTKNLLDV